MSKLDGVLNAVRAEFADSKARNPRYSVRAFARKLGISPSTLSQILRNQTKWELSQKMSIYIISQLNLCEEDQSRLLSQLGQKPHLSLQTLPDDEFEALQTWQAAFVLFSHGLSLSTRSAHIIAKKLGESLQNVEAMIERFFKSGYLTRDSVRNSYSMAKVNLKAGDGPSSALIRRHHKDSLGAALTAIDALDPSMRHFSSTTFVGDMQQLKEVVSEIETFHARMMALMNKPTSNSEVFRLNINIFPLGKTLKDNQ